MVGKLALHMRIVSLWAESLMLYHATEAILYVSLVFFYGPSISYLLLTDLHLGILLFYCTSTYLPRYVSLPQI